jgi:hypothetical protein
MATLLSTQAQKTKHYQTDQQVKYLHLEAEIEMLLQKVTAYKEQKHFLAEFSSKSSEINP